jgi:hypothetical protein
LEINTFEEIKPNIIINGSVDEHWESFNQLYKRVPDGVIAEFLGFKYQINESNYNITLSTNSDRLDIRLFSIMNLSEAKEINTYLEEIYSIIQNRISDIVKDIIGG